jgi:EamA domain-containing membrane protein RarD
MKEIRLSIPELALIASTRAALGAGAALLLGDSLTRDQKKAVGWTLLLVGVVTTVPLLANVIAKRVKV